MTKKFPRNLVTFLLMLFMMMLVTLPFIRISTVAAQDSPPRLTPPPFTPPPTVTSRPTRIISTSVPLTAVPRPTLTPTPIALTVPAACLNDQGSPVIPRIDGPARALVLNFNHALDTEYTEGCIVEREPIIPDPGSIEIDGMYYQVVNCDIVDNGTLLAVGNGMARFDGTFHIECNQHYVASPYIELSDFYVYARAQFHSAGPNTYSLVSQSSLQVDAMVDANWHVELSSQYGDLGTPFTHMDNVTNVQNSVVPMLSWLHYDAANEVVKGRHSVDRRWLPPATTANEFYLNGDDEIIIGESTGGASWDLHILIIDPPNTY